LKPQNSLKKKIFIPFGKIWIFSKNNPPPRGNRQKGGEGFSGNFNLNKKI
jgi:hypothetical protein